MRARGPGGGSPAGSGPGARPFVSAVILAAGASRRFGANKLLAALGDAPLVRRTAENTLAAGVREGVVVLGHEAERVGEALAGLPLRFVVNVDYAAGMSGSLRVGVAAISDRARAALVVLGDQPFVEPAIIDRLIAVYRRTGRPIVVPVYAGTRGNPVLFDRSLFPELLSIEGDRGARELIDRMLENVAAVDFPFDPPPDVDTPAAYDSAVRRHTCGH